MKQGGGRGCVFSLSYTCSLSLLLCMYSCALNIASLCNPLSYKHFNNRLAFGLKQNILKTRNFDDAIKI